MALSSDETLILTLVLVVLMTFVVFFELKVMRTKSKEVRVASQKKDEAFNAVLTTRTVMNTVKNRGGEIGDAPIFLERAKDAMNRGRFESCVEYCERARAELKSPTPKGSGSTGGDADARASLEAVAERIVSSRSDTDTYKGTKLESPKEGNYLGARFEISAAKADIGRAAASGLDTSIAEGMMVQADSAYTAGNYDKALSLAVRARKSINARSDGEMIPLKAVDERAPATEAGVFDVEEPPRSKPKKERQCKDCGAVLDKEDAFCPICGMKVTQPACPQCGAPSKAGDKFCRKCGATVN